jgi:arabinogalactan endo-1,4-beta-galactosidase
MNYKSIINLLLILFLFPACGRSSDITAQEPTGKDTTGFAKGADVSWLTQMEKEGCKFYNAAGTETECMTLLRDLGMNSVRLRVWVNPANGWCDKSDLLIKAQRANNSGMRIMIDFHYSDSWADPGKQNKPAAWATLSFDSLKIAVAAHTKDILTALKANGITPEWVQVGNETDDGLLWETGRASANMSNYAGLIKAGYEASKSVFPDTKVIVHVSNGYNNSLFRWNFDGLKANGAKWDVIGMSLYPSYAKEKGYDTWQKVNDACLANINDMISRYGTEVMICEVGMPWDEADSCKAFLTDLIAKAESVPNNKCLGVFYWEPEGYVNWSHYTLSAFDNSGKPTVALDAFK